MKDQHPVSDASPSLADLRAMTARFAPAEIGADVTALPEGERRALAKLVEAAKLMDSLFLRQVWAGNDAMLQDLARAAVTKGPAAADRARPRPRRGCTTSSSTRGRGPGSITTRCSFPARRRNPSRAISIPRAADKAAVQHWLDSLTGDGPRVARPDSSPRSGGRQRRRARSGCDAVHCRPVQRRVSGRARPRRDAAARGRGADRRSRR